MKKIIVLLLSLCILISLSIPSYAAGVDYEYSSEWFTAILNNTSWRAVDTDSNITRGSYSNSNIDFLSLDGKIFGYNAIGDKPFPVVVNSFRGNDIVTLNNFIPLDVTLVPNQTIELSFVILFTSALSNPDDFYVGLNFSYNSVAYSFSSSTVNYDEIILGDLIYDSSGDIITGIFPNFRSQGQLITFTYTNNSTINQNLSSLNMLMRAPSGENFNSLSFGFVSNNTSSVVLPSYVEQNLIEIGNELKKQTSYLDEITAILDILVEGMDSVGAAVGSISSSSSSYQDKVINPTPEDVEKDEEVNQVIEQEKQEQDEILETLDEMNQYVPTDDTLDSMQEHAHTMVDVTKTSPSFQTAIGDLFFNSIFLPILLAAFGFATASYVFFGKR